MKQTMTHKMELHYYFDPLCGWCYASAPGLDALAREYADALTMMPSGLFVAPRPVANIADHAWTNDQRIGTQTGQVFSEDYHHNVLLAPNGLFSSDALTLALVALGELNPALEHTFLHRAQIARYVDGHDTSRPEIVARIAADVANASGSDVTPAEIEKRLREDTDLHSKTQSRVHDTQKKMSALGIRGVPQLVVHTGGRSHILDGQILYAGGTALLTEIHKLSDTF